MRDDEFAWEPYGAAMSMSVKASLSAEGQIADWQYELWSNTHSMRPESTDGTNVLAEPGTGQWQRPQERT